MWKRELIKNKLYALILIGIGALTLLIEGDGTFFVFSLMLGLPVFFSKENCILEKEITTSKEEIKHDAQYKKKEQI